MNFKNMQLIMISIKVFLFKTFTKLSVANDKKLIELYFEPVVLNVCITVFMQVHLLCTKE